MCSVLSMTSVTCAKPIWLRFSVPPKITSSILAAPQLAAVLLAHDPADGVGDIGLAGAVWPHDGGDVLTEVQHRLIREALEALDFQSPKVHESLTSFMFAYNN